MADSIDLPYRDYRRIGLPRPAEVHTGLDGVVHQWVGRYRRRLPVYRRLQQRAERIHATADGLHGLDRGELDARLSDHRERFRRGVDDADVDAALASLVELADRVLGQRPRAVQLMGALGLEQSFLVEMATGEGKSLTAAIAAVLVGWRGRPCHVLTVNDYLASRDAVVFAEFYAACGLSVAAVTEAQDEQQRRSAYAAALVYTTAKQLLADFLRDRLHIGAVGDPARALVRGLAGRSVDTDRLVLRGLDTAIVDEADSVLIDEAVSPLIISRPGENQEMAAAIGQANTLAEGFRLQVHYRCDHRHRDLRLTGAGKRLLDERARNLPGIWRGPRRREELMLQALRARELYRRDRDYVIRDGKVVIVDELTGRLAEQRSWSQGLHQAVEAKEGVEITAPSETLLRMSFQRFFRLFRRLSGMSGTVSEAADELWRIYSLPVLPVPAHRPCRRVVQRPKIARDDAAKWQAIAEEVRAVHGTGQPVLVGTRTVEQSERLAGRLAALGIAYALLNAVRNEHEAEIVAAAGQPGAVTIATNMAGRGTDIALGPGVADLGGLHVIVTEQHASRRIDRQLIGRTARQGEPGSARVFMSPEDEVLKRFSVVARLPAGIRPGVRLLPMLIDRAQRAAERLAFRQRREVLRTDTWLEEALTFGDPRRAGL